MRSKDIPNLHKLYNKKVKVETYQNKKFIGELKGHDAFMNLVIVEKECLKVIRGDNILNVKLFE